MNLQIMVHVEPYPATEALQRATSQIPSMESRRAIDSGIRTLNEFRDTYLTKTFDMTDLLLATRPVEDSIAFPKIEWVDDNANDSENDVMGSSTRTALTAGTSSDSWCSSPSCKRHFDNISHHRLVRSKSRHTCLSSLGSFGSVATPGSGTTFSSCSSWGHFFSDDEGSSILSFGSNFLSFENPRMQRSQYMQHVQRSMVEG